MQEGNLADKAPSENMPEAHIIIKVGGPFPDGTLQYSTVSRTGSPSGATARRANANS